MEATAPPVLLGLRDAPVLPGGLPFRGSLSSKLGGSPDCPLVALAQPACGLCGAASLHVVQLYCPLEGSPYHRLVNVFACAAESCWGHSESWKVLRSQYLHVPGKEMQDGTWKQERTAGAAAWCDGADDWGEDGEAASSELRVASVTIPRDGPWAARFQRLSLEESAGVSHPFHPHQPAEGGQGKPQSVPQFRSYYISVVDEEDYLGGDDHAQRLFVEYQQREHVDLKQLMSASCSADGEKYEKNEAKKRNKVFHGFMKRISACQEQILRYSWGGQPLLISKPPVDIAAAVPPCRNCHSRRIFEFQLMPAMVHMLKVAEKAETSVEFGTALVYTCEKSCWTTRNSAPLEEYIFVQEDPDHQMFK